MSDDDLVEVDFSRDLDFEEPHIKIELSITDLNIVSKGMKKHVEYQIKGRDGAGDFFSTRRYKEFFALRSLLAKYWPGCFVPQIPPKKAFGNMTSLFIERRRRLLELFLVKKCTQPYLFTCDIFQAVSYTHLTLPTNREV